MMYRNECTYLKCLKEQKKNSISNNYRSGFQRILCQTSKNLEENPRSMRIYDRGTLVSLNLIISLLSLLSDPWRATQSLFIERFKKQLRSGRGTKTIILTGPSRKECGRSKGSRRENNFTDARPTSRRKVTACLIACTAAREDIAAELQGKPAGWIEPQKNR